MSSINDSFDELAQIVQFPSGHAASLALRDAVLHQTVSVIQSRRRWKRIALATALAGCYVAGMFTISLWRSAGPSTQNVVSNSAPFAPGSAGGPNGQSMSPSPSPSELRELELASTAPVSPYENLRRSGDRLLTDDTDIPGAIRSYKRALQLASVNERTISVDHDTWLMMALKSDQSNSSIWEKMP